MTPADVKHVNRPVKPEGKAETAQPRGMGSEGSQTRARVREATTRPTRAHARAHVGAGFPRFTRFTCQYWRGFARFACLPVCLPARNVPSLARVTSPCSLVERKEESPR